MVPPRFVRTSLCVAFLWSGCRGDKESASPEPFGPTSSVIHFDGAPPKNVLMISVDTLRRDHLGMHGELGLTPFLDELAQQGVWMADHQQCANWTIPGTTCTLTGNHIVDLEIALPLHTVNTIPQGTPTLARWLGDAGYVSVVSTSNDFFSSVKWNTQGYDAEVQVFGELAGPVFTQGLSTLEEQFGPKRAKPWFLHLHHFEPHQPYDPAPEYIVGRDALEPWIDDLTLDENLDYWGDRYATLSSANQELLAAHVSLLYQAEVRMLDRGLADYWQTLDEQGWLDDTLVVFWSDHGEQLFERGYRGHAYQLYGEENDGALFFWAKNIKPAVYSQPSHAVDVVPTVLQLLEIVAPDGLGGYPIGSAPLDRPRFSASAGRLGNVQSVTLDGYKMHYSWSLGAVKVFDRTRDPSESTDIFDATDATVLHLWSLLRPQIEAMHALMGPDVHPPRWPADLP